MKTIICQTKDELGAKAAAEGAELIRRAINDRNAANIIVATGGSQTEMLQQLVQSDGIDWRRVTAFHLDEYIGMPVTHPASFRLYLWQRFASKLPLPLKRMHFVEGDSPDPAAECMRLGEIIRTHPIDVAFVGIGENGHLAFNDPPADFDTDQPYIVVNLDEACRRQQTGEGWFKTLEDVPARAISMSIRQVMKSAALIVSVPDRRKAEAVKRCLGGEISPQAPASILQGHSQCSVYLDRESASMLDTDEGKRA